MWIEFFIPLGLLLGFRRVEHSNCRRPDRLLHKAEVVRIDGDSYRAKESAERNAQREKARRKKT